MPLAIVVALAAVIAYRWAARRGQFDDLVTPAIRMLHDDPPPQPPSAAPPAGDGGEGRAEPE